LVRAFNDCLSALISFRNNHIQLVAKYVVMQGAMVKRPHEETGTGGSGLM
jgi:hypothetical protein